MDEIEVLVILQYLKNELDKIDYKDDELMKKQTLDHVKDVLDYQIDWLKINI